MRRSRPELLIAIATLALGCKGSTGDTGDTGDTDEAPRCGSELSEWLGAALAEGRGIESQPGVELLRTDQPPRRVELAPQLWLGRDVSELDRAPVENIEQSLAQLGARLPGDKRRLLVVADKNTAWERIGRVAASALAHRLSPLEFVVTARGVIAAPEHAVIEALAMVPPASPAPQPPPASAFDTCPAAKTLAVAVGQRPDDANLARYAGEIGAVIESCGCADASAARAVLWYWLRRYSGEPFTTISVELSTDGGVLVLDGDTPWSKAIDSVRPLEGPVRLGVASE